MQYQSLLSSAMLVMSLASPSAAAECRQERAIYEDRDKAYELTFEPVDSAAAASSHHFKVRVEGSDAVLDGFVLTGDDVPRPNGMIMNNCPEGDATGEEIAACTVWEGVIYAADTAGVLGVLPPAGTDAAAQLLFPGFGPAIRYSALWETKKATVAPWDVLTFKGCAS